MAGSFNHFGELAGALAVKGDLVVEKIARDAEAECRMRSRVDTGAMRNAWAVRTPGLLHREVFNHMEYAIFNEMGTVRMSAQPMLIPAFERQRPVFELALRKLLVMS